MSDPKRLVAIMWLGEWIGVPESGEAIKGKDLDALIPDAREDAPVLDLQGVNPGQAMLVVACGPKPDPKLGPDEYKPALPQPTGPDGPVKVLSSEDRIGVNLWVNAWTTIPGAKVGHVRGGAIVWEAPELRPTQAAARC